jgi:adenylate cyclase
LATEIERKFLVAKDGWRKKVWQVWKIRQGYLPTSDGVTVRVRTVLKPEGAWAFLTVKGPTMGISRPEFEWAIRLDEAHKMLDKLCGDRIVEKDRHILPTREGLKWEVDVFAGRHNGLVLAEIELASSDEKVRLPRWLGREVSEDSRFSNHSLAIHGLTMVSACPACGGILKCGWHQTGCGRLIPVKRQPDLEPPYERCCFCRTPTTMWTALKDRAPGGQVACCKDCSLSHTQDEVPSKKDWCDKENKLTPRFGR